MVKGGAFFVKGNSVPGVLHIQMWYNIPHWHCCLDQIENTNQLLLRNMEVAAPAVKHDCDTSNDIRRTANGVMGVGSQRAEGSTWKIDTTVIVDKCAGGSGGR